MEHKKKSSFKNGRPAKGEDKLTRSVNLKLTEADYNRIKEKAGKLGLIPTQYAREMTLNGKVKNRFTLEELDLIRKVAGMANNLNQLTKRAHIAGFRDVYSEVLIMVDYFKELINDR